MTRERNLKFVIKWWKSKRPDAKILVTEQNTETKVDNDIKHIKIKCNHAFSRSLGFNEGVKHCKNNDVMILCDNDCILENNTIDNLEKKLEDCDLFIPYYWCNDLDYEETHELIKNNSTIGLKGNPRKIQNKGGIHIIKYSAYEIIGGFDPQFIGWGCEDDAFFEKANKLIKINRGNQTMYHLHHTVQYEKGKNPEFLKNEKELQKISIMDNEELKKYITKLGKKHFKKYLI
jgi:predicted glycosyltransferase involved in capsule biosynthesis